MAGETHAERVEQAFRAQASAFEVGAAKAVFTSDAAWITDGIDCQRGDLVLDVAAGTGHAARALAPRVRSVVALDATAAMLQTGQASARADGTGNVVFMRGDAEALPFLDGTFDTVISRFAFHHLERPAVVLAEMVRCTRPGGQVVVADLVADSDPAVAARQDRLEILRDPSHTALLARRDAESLFAAAGLALAGADTNAVERPIEPWLAQSRTPEAVADEIRAVLRDEIAGGPATGLAPRESGGDLWFTQTFAAYRGIRPTE